MHTIRQSTKAITLTVLALSLLVLVATVGTAVLVRAQGAAETILSCVGGNGNLRVVDATEECLQFRR